MHNPLPRVPEVIIRLKHGQVSSFCPIDLLQSYLNSASAVTRLARGADKLFEYGLSARRYTLLASYRH
ncbi:hypothetical protein BHM03_00024385 [Ensete ventricosum]|nr:hypothetical protein BHM03_00024385 [Ensete ventricosum]